MKPALNFKLHWEWKAQRSKATDVVFGQVCGAKWNRLADMRSFTNLRRHLRLDGGRHTLLDVGCGPLARAEVQYSVQGFHIVGVDVSKTTVKKARKNVEKYGNPQRVSLIVADGEYLPFKRESFDVALCIGTISHFPDKQAVVSAMKEMRDVTKQNGTIYIPWWINFLSLPGIACRLALKILDFLKFPHAQYLAFIGTREIKGIIHHCGLHVRQIRYGDLLELPWIFYPVSPTLRTQIERVITMANNYHKSHPLLARFSGAFEITCAKALEEPLVVSNMRFAESIP